MINLNSQEQRVAEVAKYLQSNQPGKWSSSEKRFEEYYRLIHEDLLRRILPKIESSNEPLVSYWPTRFLWGQKAAQKRTTFDDRTYLYKMGVFGTGYTCLTLSNVHLVSLQQLTKQFPLFETGMTGFVGKVFGRMDGEVDDRQPLREDRAYTIPNELILGVQVVQDDDQKDAIALRTVNEQILLYPHFSGQREDILLAFRMVQSGKLAQTLGLSPQQPVEPQIPTSSTFQDDPVTKLKHLKELLDTGLITDAEYAAKKAEILSKM